METNKVTLDLNYYNYLRDFHDKFTDKNTIVVKRWVPVYHSGTINYIGYIGNSADSNVYITESQAVTEIAQLNRLLEKERDQYRAELFNLRNPSEKKEDINDLKQNGLFGIIKWWFKNKK
jgi:hypothetical protein